MHANGRSILYGDIVSHGKLQRAYTSEQLRNIPIKAPGERRLIGRDTMALDVPSKTNGAGRYGIDAVVEGMIYALPKIPPTHYDSKVVSIDDSAARHLPGYIQSLALDDPSDIAPGWVMVCAESFAVANHAADLVKVTWRSGDAAHVSERDLQNRAAELIEDVHVATWGARVSTLYSHTWALVFYLHCITDILVGVDRPRQSRLTCFGFNSNDTSHYGSHIRALGGRFGRPRRDRAGKRLQPNV
ncbi:MAG: hypothetical protein ABSF64_40415 [Bryobacteraceae bacterium]